MTFNRLSFVQSVWKNFIDANGFDAHVIGKMKIVNVLDGKITCELAVEDYHLNRLESLHGGLISTLIDVGGSLSIATKGLHSTGLSTDLNVSFVNTAKKNDIVIMDAECVKLGKTLAHTIIELKNKNNENKLIAQGRHTKFVSIAHNDDKNIFKKN